MWIFWCKNSQGCTAMCLIGEDNERIMPFIAGISILDLFTLVNYCKWINGILNPIENKDEREQLIKDVLLKKFAQLNLVSKPRNSGTVQNPPIEDTE